MRDTCNISSKIHDKIKFIKLTSAFPNLQSSVNYVWKRKKK